MDLQSLVDNLYHDTLQVSLPLFWPELAVCGTILVLLVVRLFRLGQRIDPFWIALAGSAVAFWFALPNIAAGQWTGVAREELFTGMLVYDSLTVFFRMFLLAFAVAFIVLVRMTGLADRIDGQDFYTLLLGATLGMILMASANHLMMVFLAVEMASVPSFVMAGILKGRRRSSEAALKYAVYSAGAAGIMLYGISLLAGLTGAAHIPTIAARLVEMDIPGLIEANQAGGTLMVLALSGLMIMVGLAFKLSAVPFHFWCPDVFEGGPAEVGAFLSVASKAAAMALVVRIALGLTTPGDAASAPVSPTAHHPTPIHTAAFQHPPGVAPDEPAGEAASAAGRATNPTPLAPIRSFIVQLLAVIAAVTCTFGNLAAYGQTNIKRLLAYSTIAHAGYMMMAITAAVHLAGHDASAAQQAVAALLFYLVAYVFMNLGAFAIVAFLRNALGSEEIADYAGLIRTAPLAAVALTVILVSLVGLPPLAGFVGKFLVFWALVVAGGPLMIGLLVLAGVNTAISLVYYIRVAKVMCIDPAPADRAPISIGILPAAYTFAISLPVLIYGIYWRPIIELAEQATRHLSM